MSLCAICLKKYEPANPQTNPRPAQKYMTIKKTSSNRVKELRERREALGIVQVNLYAHKDDVRRIKDYAAKLQKARDKTTSQEQ